MWIAYDNTLLGVLKKRPLVKSISSHVSLRDFEIDNSTCIFLLKNHTDFDDCCFDAQKFDDNCDHLHNKASSSSSIFGESAKNIDSNALVDMIVRRL